MRQARAHHRHQLRTLTYVTFDQANGGIVRNISREGIGVQVVAAVRPRQQLRVHFELRYPRLRVETRGEVMWATHSGRCGIRLLDVSPRMSRQINEWIFGNLLEGISLHSEGPVSMFCETKTAMPELRPAEHDDGLMLSAAPVKVIELPIRPEPAKTLAIPNDAAGTCTHGQTELDWLSQPLSGRGLAWTVNTLVIVAAILLFALVFLAITRESPRWPLAVVAGAAIPLAALYWGFFKLFGGPSPGARLARLAGYQQEEDDEAGDARFR